MEKTIGTDFPHPTPKSWVGGRIGCIVLLLCVGIALAIFFPAVEQARTAARKMQSNNNLKQIALSLLTYEDYWKRLPTGADFDLDGHVLHGWVTHSIAALDQSQLYSRLRKDHPWDSARNRHLMRDQLGGLQIPGVADSFTIEGYWLMHYMGNPNMFHRSHSVRFEEMTSGLSNSWLVGEVDGKYQPWGYPFNWRPLKLPFNQRNGSYGAWPDGFLLCFADASIKFLPNRTSETVVQSLASAPPVATPEQTIVPNRTFQSSKMALKHYSFESESSDPRDFLGIEIFFDESERPVTADLSRLPHNVVYGKDSRQRIDLVGVSQNYSEIRELIYPSWVLDDTNAKLLVGLQKLDTLYVREIALTSDGIACLQSLPKLTTVAYSTETESVGPLKAALPNCTFDGPDTQSISK